MDKFRAAMATGEEKLADAVGAAVAGAASSNQSALIYYTQNLISMISHSPGGCQLLAGGPGDVDTPCRLPSHHRGCGGLIVRLRPRRWSRSDRCGQRSRLRRSCWPPPRHRRRRRRQAGVEGWRSTTLCACHRCGVIRCGSTPPSPGFRARRHTAPPRCRPQRPGSQRAQWVGARASRVPAHCVCCPQAAMQAQPPPPVVGGGAAVGAEQHEAALRRTRREAALAAEEAEAEHRRLARRAEQKWEARWEAREQVRQGRAGQGRAGQAGAPHRRASQPASQPAGSS
eukprot:COSAG01_NODE_10024_length_2272_cov_3.996318_2_plen_285_part_00